MKKELFIVCSGLALLAGCGGNKEISLNGDWTASQAYFEGKPDKDTTCQSEYDSVSFTDDTATMNDTQYSLTKEQKENETILTLVDDFSDTKKYIVKEAKNGNIIMHEADVSTGCELKKK
ncbi:hypothetical protein [Priestia aryabhattai]|uniref:hypothetical protein n=1 Tax=Priestia aryabhattai TaxID=412384 RepID=UPI001C8E473B|nr:hypothetical protein [Priestia aryabhattai]MBX9998188.1 hypothetical protein [Priestia aryabhattai]